MKLRDRLFGDKNFYRAALAIALPIMAQNGMTNFVSMLDNIMVGRVGTDAISAVAIVNQIMFVYGITIFGGVSGASIFGAQFFGKGDHEGLRNTFRFRLGVCALVSLCAVLLGLFCDERLISMYLHTGGSTGSIPETLALARSYFRIMLLSLPPFALSQTYASTLRDTGQTRVPMRASFAALFVNLIGNYVLIFGHMGFAPMGVRGAAIATVLARYVECFVMVRWTHDHEENCPFIVDAYRTFRIPAALARSILARSAPLLCNEFLWALGLATQTQCYSMRGLSVMAATNIASTVINLFSVIYLSLGGAVGIIVGNLLGADKMEEARRTSTRLTVFSVGSCLLVSLLMVLGAPLFPQLYNTTEEVRTLARDLLRIYACFLPLHAYLDAAYYTMRSGGKTLLTLFMDSGFTWVACIPLAYFLSRYTAVPIRPMYALVLSTGLVKAAVLYGIVRSGKWMNNLVAQGETLPE